jgi:hypothetical protein
MNVSTQVSRSIALLTVVSNIQAKGAIQAFCDVMPCRLTVTDVSKDHNAFVFRIKQYKKILCIHANYSKQKWLLLLRQNCCLYYVQCWKYDQQFLLSHYTQIDGITFEILLLLRSKFDHTCSYT